MKADQRTSGAAARTLSLVAVNTLTAPPSPLPLPPPRCITSQNVHCFFGSNATASSATTFERVSTKRGSRASPPCCLGRLKRSALLPAAGSQGRRRPYVSSGRQVLATRRNTLPGVLTPYPRPPNNGLLLLHLYRVLSASLSFPFTFGGCPESKRSTRESPHPGGMVAQVPS